MERDPALSHLLKLHLFLTVVLLGVVVGGGLLVKRMPVIPLLDNANEAVTEARGVMKEMSEFMKQNQGVMSAVGSVSDIVEIGELTGGDEDVGGIDVASFRPMSGFNV